MKSSSTGLYVRSAQSTRLGGDLRGVRARLLLLLISFGLFSAGCGGSPEKEADKGPGQVPASQAPSTSGSDLGQRVLGEMLRAWIRTPTGPRLVSYEVIDGFAIMEGDIIIGRADELLPIQPGEEANPPIFEKGAYLNAKWWTGAVVRYSALSVAVNLPSAQRADVLAAMQIWTTATGIRFEDAPGISPTGNYITFTASTECSSSVGMVGNGQQWILLAPDCDRRTIVHELGHAIGLFHEHARSDRGSYVAVYDGNLQAGKYDRGFKPWNETGQPGFDTPALPDCSLPAYNFKSQMHYSSRAFTANDWPTMLRKAESLVSGPSPSWYRRTGLNAWEAITTSSISNRKLGYGLFNANANADIFRSDGGKWYYSPDGVQSWTQLRSAPQVYRKLRSETSVLFGDFDGNGRTDAMVESGGVWQVSWNATDAFVTLNPDARLGGVVRRPADLATGDFDGDGATDILGISAGNYYVRSGGTEGWWLYADLTTALPDPWTVGYGDFNGDHVTDIFRVNGSTWEILAVGLLGSSWQAYKTSAPAGILNQNAPLGSWQHSLALGDFDGDGFTDVLYTAGPDMQLVRTALGPVGNPIARPPLNFARSLTPFHFDNFNFNFVHTCKTLSAGPQAGAWRCHAGSDISGDGSTDIISTQIAPVEIDGSPTLSASDISAACLHYGLAQCVFACKPDVP